jgi:hypothetical protein
VKRNTFRHLAMTLALLVPSILSAQGHPAPSSAEAASRHRQDAPCLKQAGISATTWEEIQTIHKGILQQVTSICQNSSLTTDQKRQQVQGAFQKGQHQIRNLLSPQQQEAFRACQQQRQQERQQNRANEGQAAQPEEQYQAPESSRQVGIPDPCMRLLRGRRGQEEAPARQNQRQKLPQPR